CSAEPIASSSSPTITPTLSTTRCFGACSLRSPCSPRNRARHSERSPPPLPARASLERLLFHHPRRQPPHEPCHTPRHTPPREQQNDPDIPPGPCHAEPDQRIGDDVRQRLRRRANPPSLCHHLRRHARHDVDRRQRIEPAPAHHAHARHEHRRA